ncbi:unnamed protein product [Rhizophagus irregularis]|nr:unnamed protein product [Rhizophagus irregularis]
MAGIAKDNEVKSSIIPIHSFEVDLISYTNFILRCNKKTISGNYRNWIKSYNNIRHKSEMLLSFHLELPQAADSLRMFWITN